MRSGETEPTGPARPALVLGYGNTIRGDDGVGPRAAAAVLDWGLPDVDALAVTQLTPELAEPISTARLAIFVDARLTDDEDTGEVEVQPLEPIWGKPILGHAADPRSLLALALEVFGACPRAWLVTVPSADFGLGETLSPCASRGLRNALERVALLLQ